MTILGSGSAGNSTLLVNGAGRLLVDAGLSRREIVRRLVGLGIDPASVSGIILTHAHGDHVRGAGRFSRKFGVPVYATRATQAALQDGSAGVSEWRTLVVNRPLEICGLRCLPFAVPHDAVETLAFRIETPEGAIGFATDVGAVTEDLIHHFRDCILLVLEANHAADLLRVSPYAAPVRARIGSPDGHLSNEALAAFLRGHLDRSVRCVVLAHLSRVNNVPEIAEMTCRAALAQNGRDDVRLVVARQDRVSEVIDLSRLRGGGVSHWAAPRSARQYALPFSVKPEPGTGNREPGTLS